MADKSLIRAGVIVVTGGIASGKTLITSYMSKLGFLTINLDEMAHLMLSPQGAAYIPVSQAFPNALDINKCIDRNKLSNNIINNIVQTRILTNIMHPLLRRAYEEKIQSMSDVRSIVVEIPLMIEAILNDGYEYYNDITILVSSSYSSRLKRALDRNYMTKEKFDAIIAQQLPDDVKAQHSDFIVENENMLAVLKQVREIAYGCNTRRITRNSARY